MRRGADRIAAVVLLAVIGAASYSLWRGTGSGKGAEHVLLGESPDPYGQLVAYRIEQRSGAAERDRRFRVTVARVGVRFDPAKSEDWVWRAREIEPLEVEWIAPDTLLVIVEDSPHTEEFSWTVRKQARFGIFAITERRSSEAAPEGEAPAPEEPAPLFETPPEETPAEPVPVDSSLFRFSSARPAPRAARIDSPPSTD